MVFFQSHSNLLNLDMNSLILFFVPWIDPVKSRITFTIYLSWAIISYRLFFSVVLVLVVESLTAAQHSGGCLGDGFLYLPKGGVELDFGA
jgi:hypothetical protein